MGEAYTWLSAIAERPQILVAGSYGALGDALPALASTGVEGVALDLVAGAIPPAEDLAGLAGKTVVAGIVSGRNIWRNDLSVSLTALEALADRLPAGTPITVGTFFPIYFCNIVSDFYINIFHTVGVHTNL